MYSLLLLSSRDIVLASKVGGMVPHFFLLLCEVNSRKSLEFIQIIICSSRNLLGLDYALRNSPENMIPNLISNSLEQFLSNNQYLQNILPAILHKILLAAL